MKVLHLTLKKEWFDMIASGVKKEEYRELKDYWKKRLEGKAFTHVHFRNGYAKDAPVMVCELNAIRKGLGVKEWGAQDNTKYYVLMLGKQQYLRR